MNVQELIGASFARVGFLSLLGAELVGATPGEVRIALPFSARISQQHGFAHGGAIATVLDAACGYAAMTLMPAGSEVLSVEFKVNFLAPAVGERFEAHGRVVRAGRTITVCQGEVTAFAGSERRAIAAMQATMIRVDGQGRAGSREPHDGAAGG